MRLTWCLAFLVMTSTIANAQKIVPITYNGQKYEVLDLSGRGKVTWGGYGDRIPGDGAKSETNGVANTRAIISAVGNNSAFEGKPYAAKICIEARDGGHEDWYLPSKEEAGSIYQFKDKFKVEERGSIWTSTEYSATTAVSVYWYTGSFYNVMKVDGFQLVCLRKVDE